MNNLFALNILFTIACDVLAGSKTTEVKKTTEVCIWSILKREKHKYKGIYAKMTDKEPSMHLCACA